MSIDLADPADDWKRFVLEHGFRTPLHHLAAIVGHPTQEIDRVRKTGAATRRKKAKEFAELFMLWYGREPADDEWPVPRRAGGQGYEWLGPEVTLLASLIGQVEMPQVVDALTNRLRMLTGDPSAERNQMAVQIRMNLIGMVSTDVLGGITVTAAGQEIGSVAIVREAIRRNHLKSFRHGRLIVIPHEAWAEWKSKRVLPPEGYVQLSTIREALAIRSDKLPEYARMGYVPSAILCESFGASVRTSGRGSWYIKPDVAQQLVADRQAGRPMPWHGKPMLDNLKITFALWQERQHPVECETCTAIWGPAGAPTDFDEYLKVYPPLDHGAKRHLTRPWTPGLTLAEVVTHTGASLPIVKKAIENCMLATSTFDGRQYVSKTDATRWKANHCRTGESELSWISLATATKTYGFSEEELRSFIADGRLLSKLGTFGAMNGITYVSRHQCGQLRETIGFTEEEAARRVGVSIERFRQLLKGVNWRQAERIPLVTVDAVKKRKASREGYTFEEAAAELEMSVEWVYERRNDGTIRVLRSKFDERHVYISEPMMVRLRDARDNPAVRQELGADWLLLSDAAYEAGVSIGTITKWAEEGTLQHRAASRGLCYHRQAVRARARHYWATTRRRSRAVLPSWLQDEKAGRVEAPVVRSGPPAQRLQRLLRTVALPLRPLRQVKSIAAAIDTLTKHDHVVVKLAGDRYLFDGIESLSEQELLALVAVRPS